MPSLKEVRIRIASVKSTQQITSAMKMVAASKLRRAQSAILRLRPYAAKLQEFLKNLSSSLDSSDAGSVYSSQRSPEKVLLILISSNRGLCGAFNANVIKKANAVINGEYSKQFSSGNLSIITIGKKVSEFYRKRKFKVIESHDSIFDKLTFENVVPLAEKVMKLFEEKHYDRIEIIYNQFKNAATQKIECEQFLPVKPVEIPEGKQKVQKIEYIFEPGKDEIIRDLIPKSLKIQFYKALLDSFAAEHGARMTAMHQATDNAKELLKDLSLAYNKARQAAITREILEIVGGAEALKG
ncbi:MAG: ATP synthase F1 subunit gamma [Bacteroidetes bacterium]|nr:ATP synthase F1 subunit gamma [Bacteroidota bacterium]